MNVTKTVDPAEPLPPSVPKSGGNLARTIGSTAGIAAVASSFDPAVWSSPKEFLTWAGTTAGTGLLIFGLIEGVDKLLRPRGKQLSGTVKFYGAVVLAFLIPFAAWAGLASQGHAEWGAAGVLAAILSGLRVAETLHFEGEKDPANQPPGVMRFGKPEPDDGAVVNDPVPGLIGPWKWDANRRTWVPATGYKLTGGTTVARHNRAGGNG
jgi:hypothetical protein